MIRIEFDINTDQTRKVAQALARALTPERMVRVVERTAFEAQRDLIKATPKKWFGQVRRGWKVDAPSPDVRRVFNENKIMRFLEYGTANGGTGFIKPKVKKFLYIPLKRGAAAGWHSGLKIGKDYILRKQVRGIKPMGIVAAERAKAGDRLKANIRAFIDRALQQAGINGQSE